MGGKIYVEPRIKFDHVCSDVKVGNYWDQILYNALQQKDMLREEIDRISTGMEAVYDRA
jgi:hypothetical protein